MRKLQPRAPKASTGNLDLWNRPAHSLPMLAFDEFERTLARLWALLESIPAGMVDVKPRPEDWSAKDVACHLVDSASNNHQRFTRLQRTARLAFPGYETEPWVAVEKPERFAWNTLLDLLKAYNGFLLHLARNLDPSCLGNVWLYEGKEISLEFLVGEYYRHLDWHAAHLETRMGEVRRFLVDKPVAS